MKGTNTTHGFIPNVYHAGIELVAKVEVTNAAQKICDPIIRFGRVVYALPGGGEFVGGRVESVIK